MIGLLRRLQPANPALAVLYWLSWTVAALGLLFLLFYFLDTTFDFSGRFFSPSVEP